MRSPRLLAVLLAALSGLLLTAAPALAAPPDRLDLPAPTGRLAVGTTALHVVDRNRPDPWAPTPGPRELMAQAWYPALPVTPRARYGDEAVSEDTAMWFNRLTGGGVQPFLHRVRPNARQDAPVFGARWPVVLYSHGRGSGKTFSATLGEELASHGFVVLSVDHTYDAGAVRFPDGRVAKLNRPEQPTEAELAAEVQVRAADLRGVLDHVSTGNTPLRGRLDLGRVAAVGHSIGGDTAAEVMRLDPRIRVGANMDGAFWGPAATQGTTGPFLLLTTGLPDHGSWTGFKAAHTHWGRHFATAGAAHGSFGDFDVLPDVSGLRALLADRPEEFTAVFGELRTGRATEVTRAYVRAFLEHHLWGLPRPLLDGPSAAFPEQTQRWSRP
ncbi:dienelactone hydrolase [Crossiella equi]|uniref:Dienelactone hydrolase n=1 Tax=Crossiella equi TaxID=130796 RepID=A0ABS5ALM3_9PSEU|nr:hypothetical protein [Crossiella equi]MBP2477463.1 dienelactone hydrolase [Crossiella equi]